ncbi:MAG: hypothetical protein WD048_02100 [Chitinophagales bacterium]
MRQLIVYFCLCFVFFSCGKKEKEISEFDMSFDSGIKVPAGSSVDVPLNRYTSDISTNAEQEFKDQDTRAELIEYINIDAFSLGILSPNNQSFGFAKSIKVYIDAEGLDETLIASISDISEEVGRSIELEMQSSKNYKAYLSNETFVYRVNIVNNTTVSRDIEINISSSFKVRGDIYRE